MNSALKKFRPITNKATIVLLVIVMVGFGLFADSRVANESPPEACYWTVQSPKDIGPLFSFVLFQE